MAFDLPERERSITEQQEKAKTKAHNVEFQERKSHFRCKEFVICPETHSVSSDQPGKGHQESPSVYLRRKKIAQSVHNLCFPLNFVGYRALYASNPVFFTYLVI